MGIHGLFQLIKSDAADSYRVINKNELSGKIIAIDASIALYQFLVQIRTSGTGYAQQQLMTESGEITSHLQGFLNRTANLLSSGIKPIFVFDGIPPELKYTELAKRKELKKRAEEESNKMEELIDELVISGQTEQLKDAIDTLDKANKRNIRVTKAQIEDTKHLLRLMGVPVIEAKSEAEAQCAEFVKDGIAYATGTEDMDALTFGTSIVLRKLTSPGSTNEPIIEINLNKLLESFQLTYSQFIDLCILCGCDYMETIKGIGPKTALKYIRKYSTIEKVLENLPERFIVPESYLMKVNASRAMFTSPEVYPINDFDISFKKVDHDLLLEFLVSKNFNKERVQKVIQKISKQTVDKNQPSIKSFFKKQS